MHVCHVVVAIAAATIVIAAAGVVIAVDITLLPSRHGCRPIALLLLPCHCDVVAAAAAVISDPSRESLQ